MKTLMEKKQARPATIDGLLRRETNLDIIFNASLVRAQADVRATRVLDITPGMVVVAQTSPPILQSMLDTEFEASLVSCDPMSREHTRWGWESRILGIHNAYVPKEYPDSPPAAAVFISLPPQGALRASNARMDYRLAVKEADVIHIRTNPAADGAKVLNFSAGGVMIAVPGAPQVRSGAKMGVNLVFPWPDKDSKTFIKSRARVVRVDYAEGDQAARLGLQFLEMDMETNRTFGKIINHYMLAEQRRHCI